MLDTSVIVALLRSDSAPAAGHLAQLDAEMELLLSSIVAAEVEEGLHLASDARRQRRIYATIVNALTSHEFGFDAAATFGRIRAGLRKRGELIGIADELIAAHALALGAEVATLNVADFRRVPGLKVRDWSVAA